MTAGSLESQDRNGHATCSACTRQFRPSLLPSLGTLVFLSHPGPGAASSVVSADREPRSEDWGEERSERVVCLTLHKLDARIQMCRKNSDFLISKRII